MEKCVICLDEGNTVWKINEKKCSCIIFVHNECFNQWRVQHNQCIICRELLPPVPFYVQIYYCSYDKIFTTSNIVKILQLCAYGFCMYHFILSFIDLFFYSFLMSFEEL